MGAHYTHLSPLACSRDLARLWADIICNFPNVSAMEAILKRTKSCPLKIDIMYGHSSVPKLEFALRNLHRIGTLSCYPSYDWQESLRERGPLPALRHLRLHQAIAQDCVVLNLDAPLLQSVTLENAIISSPTSSLLSLQNLRAISFTGGNPLPTPAVELYNLLSQTPRLEHLYLLLVWRHATDGGQWDRYRGKPVHLAHLRTVTLVGGLRADVAGFWRHLDAPDDLDIDISFQEDPPLSIVSAFDRQLGSSAHDTCAVHLEPEHQHVAFFSSNVASTGRRSCVKLKGGYRATLDLLPVLKTRAQMDHVTRSVLRLSGHIFYDIYGPHLVDVFRKCASVTDVTLDTGDPQNFRLFLPGSEEGTAFPALTTLSVQFHPSRMSHDPQLTYREWWSSLRDMLERRVTAGMRLKKLRLDGKWGWNAEEIRAIDGDLTSALREDSLEELVDERSWNESPQRSAVIHFTT